MLEITERSFVTIPSWMVLEHDLSANELIVYAVIYGFSHGDENQWCCVSQRYIAEWAKTTERSVRRIINRLEEMGLIQKEVRVGKNGTYCAYRAFEKPHTEEEREEDTESTLPGHRVHPTRTQSPPPPDTVSAPTSIISYNTEYNNNIKENKKRKSEEELRQDFEELWKLYPRKRGKEPAFRHYKKAIREGATNEEIRQGILNFIEDIRKKQTEEQFIPYGSSYFCEKRWNDDLSSGVKPKTCGDNKTQEFMDFEPF